jgi:hypothetical protein
MPDRPRNTSDPYQMQQELQSRMSRTDTEQKSAQTDGRATRESGEGKPPPTPTKGSQGAQGRDGAGQPTHTRSGVGTGAHEEKVGGQSQDAEGLARGDADQLTAFEDGRGNQATGDENEEDEKRGTALVDDGSAADEGAYEVPPVREQISRALAGLTREDDVDPNRPTTYKGEFVLYKPGIYQSRTMAPQMLNLKVVEATAYDAVWTEVLVQINARLKALDADAVPIDMADIHSALQLARVR